MSSLSRSFQIHLHAEPSSGQIAGESMMAITFEVLAVRLQKFDRLHFEMDGSFVWSGLTPEPWQLDGMVYDLGNQIQRIELRGRCPQTEWLMLLNAVSYPKQLLIAYDLKGARFMTIKQLDLSFWSD
jgi:hypothetical protein